MSNQSLKYDNWGLSGIGDGESEIIPIYADGEDDNMISGDLPEVLPILPLRNTVLFPGVVIPITIGRKKSLDLIDSLSKKKSYIGTLTQKNGEIDDPKYDDLYEYGTVAQVLKILDLPDGNTSVIIQGKQRFKIDSFVTDDPFIKARVSCFSETKPAKSDEFTALMGAIKEIAVKIIRLSSNIPDEATFAINNIGSDIFMINFISSNSNIDIKEKQKLLRINDLYERATQLLKLISKELQLLELRHDIKSKVKTTIDKQQKEFFLHQEMQTIQKELGDNPAEQEAEELKKKAKKKKWDKKVAEVFKKELSKFQRLNPAAAEYSLQLNYLQTLLELPWNEYTKDNFDMKHAQNILDKEHYGLEKVKERILEHLAVIKLKGDLKSPIICLHGPPGVGKTSLGKSIANALDRKYVRMSLGGLHDESEIRGHRKTYIGAMPGRIIQNLKKAQSSNPLFVLDEIDKVGKDFRGDPSFALLEVLDPEQNSTFYDNFLEMEYDLSKVMFIATANDISTINPALRDRMEMIDISGYIIEEKIEIAKRHLIPQQIKEHGIKKSDISFEKSAIEFMIDSYTRESGVRSLNKQIANVVRKIARKIAFEEDYNKKITSEAVRELLGSEKFSRDKYAGNEYAGVVTGLAWTSVGGDILYIESSLNKGKGEKLTLTGNLGNVMKESASIALQYIKANSDELGIKSEVFESWNVHVHVPEGAIPKDGPSAGITMVTSLVSAFTQRKVKKGIAMTGETTLRGKVLPVGGIREKILAAKRSGLKEIVMCEENRKNVEEINEKYLKGLKFHYVTDVNQVIDIALLKQKVDNPKKI